MNFDCMLRTRAKITLHFKRRCIQPGASTLKIANLFLREPLKRCESLELVLVSGKQDNIFRVFRFRWKFLKGKGLLIFVKSEIAHDTIGIG